MKYTTEVTVDVPRDEFIKKLDNPDNMKHWQRGLTDYKEISGTLKWLNYVLSVGDNNIDLVNIQYDDSVS
mgnify:CR=1 FL=1